ncbi:translational GTPase TypA [Microgenomates group bacterium]|nr:translational GTPase TypA [Microgenomates group bacterium]
MISQDKIRNVAIIAHVDHGKTTLVDGLLRQANALSRKQELNGAQRVMDSDQLEAERGVTILAKNTAVLWKDYKINIIDTPGHADFGGEVERVLNMADGCVLLVDAAEGVLSQTKFVLSLALKLGLKPLVVVNKIDRRDQRADEVIEEISDLFLELASSEEQLDFEVLYAVGREGVVGKEVAVDEKISGALKVIGSKNLEPLFEAIVTEVPCPQGDEEGDWQLQVTNIDYDEYKGTYAIGRIARGKIRKGERIAVVRGEEGKVGEGKIEYLFNFEGLERKEIEEAGAGEMVAIAGLGVEIKIGDTLTALNNLEALDPLEISEPTVQVQFLVSTSPFVGREGQFSTSRQLKARLDRELEKNVGLRVALGPSSESWLVSGRGELHLAILIENMRREGYEFSVGRPEVIIRENESGEKEEPWELLTIEAPEEFVGVVTSRMGERKAIFKNMRNLKLGVRFEYEIATRNLIGFRGSFMSETSGTGIVNSLFIGYRKMGEAMTWIRNGVLIAAQTGSALSYDLARLQERGITFVEPSEEVYAGMIVGENSRSGDMAMNVCKGRKLTNVRSNADVLVRLSPAKKMSLEQSLSYLAADELLEVTPLNLRLRKKDLQQAAQKTG